MNKIRKVISVSNCDVSPSRRAKASNLPASSFHILNVNLVRLASAGSSQASRPESLAPANPVFDAAASSAAGDADRFIHGARTPADAAHVEMQPPVEAQTMAQVQLEIHAPAPLGAGSPCAEHQDSRQLAPGGLQLWEASQDLAAQARDNVSALRQGACVCLCFDRHVRMQRQMTHAHAKAHDTCACKGT